MKIQSFTAIDGDARRDAQDARLWNKKSQSKRRCAALGFRLPRRFPKWAAYSHFSPIFMRLSSDLHTSSLISHLQRSLFFSPIETD